MVGNSRGNHSWAPSHERKGPEPRQHNFLPDWRLYNAVGVMFCDYLFVNYNVLSESNDSVCIIDQTNVYQILE